MSLAALALALTIGVGCQRDPTPNTPLPASFEVVTPEGRTLTAKDLRGKPWVLNFWIPG